MKLPKAEGSVNKYPACLVSKDTAPATVGLPRLAPDVGVADPAELETGLNAGLNKKIPVLGLSLAVAVRVWLITPVPALEDAPAEFVAPVAPAAPPARETVAGVLKLRVVLTSWVEKLTPKVPELTVAAFKLLPWSKK